MDSHIHGPAADVAREAGLEGGDLSEVGMRAEKRQKAAWSQRYITALSRYQKVRLHSQEAADEVAKGLEEWADLLPHRDCGPDGQPVPANGWGIGAERSVIRGLRSHLVATGRRPLAKRLGSEMGDLLETARTLDRLCETTIADPQAEQRLVGTARLQAKALADLLREIEFGSKTGGRRGGPSRARRRKPPGAPVQSDPAADSKLMDAWSQVRGKAGMSRQEFCDSRGVSLDQFIHAQDRHRKRLRLGK